MDQLSNKGKRVREEDEDSSESDIDVSDDEEMELAIHIYQAAFLPIVKKDVGLEKPDLVRDRTEMSCRVCPTGAPKLTGWKGLLGHAQTYKTKLPYKHMAYARALEQVLKAPPDAVRSKLKEKNKETFHRDVKRFKQEHEDQRALFEAQRLEMNQMQEQVEAWKQQLISRIKEMEMELEEKRIQAQQQEANYAREEHEQQRALVEAQQLEMNQIQEQAAELEAWKQQLSSRINEMEMELEERRIRAQQQEAYHAEEKQRQAARFQREIRSLDAANTAREEQLKMALERNEKVQAQERLFLLQELKYLSTVLSKMTVKEAEVLERELRKRERYEKYMHEAIAAFKEKARKTGPQPMETDHKITECAICMSALTSENRAILRPCGHARTCMECADMIWKDNKKLCPSCKTKLDDVPILVPKELYL